MHLHAEYSRLQQNAEKGKTAPSIKSLGETTQRQVKQHCLYSEQFMDSKGLQRAGLYIWSAGQMEGLKQHVHLDGFLLTWLHRDSRTLSVAVRP